MTKREYSTFLDPVPSNDVPAPTAGSHRRARIWAVVAVAVVVLVIGVVVAVMRVQGVQRSPVDPSPGVVVTCTVVHGTVTCTGGK